MAGLQDSLFNSILQFCNPAILQCQNGLKGSIGVTLPLSSYTARWK